MTTNIELERSDRGVFRDFLSGMFQESYEETVRKSEISNIHVIRTRDLANRTQCKPFNRRTPFVSLII
jgi:hypothetical protein